MEVLHLDKNQITEIEPDSFRSFDTVKTLYMADNKLVNIQDGIFLPMKNLRNRNSAEFKLY